LLQSDIERVERLLDSVESLPAYIEDRVFDVLREVDY
jgi:spore cortex formation protein SpoVR/YcgB (stage V sporulation)